MTLSIIGVGYGRTGTYSLKQALDHLGYGPCHHMYELRQRPDEVALWLDVARGTPPDFGVLFDGYGSQVDWPGSVFWREMLAAYPEAKVILTERDAGAWHDSIRQTILPSSEIGRFEDADENSRAASEMIYQLVLQRLFNGRLGDRDHAIAQFEAHSAAVRAAVPDDNLLVFRPGDGWGPLCAFLGCAVPDAPFPAGNTVSDYRRRKPYLDRLR